MTDDVAISDLPGIASPVRNDGQLIHDNQLLSLIELTLDRKNPRKWYYALMDYGSFLAKTTINPNRKSKHYTKQSKFEGSLRQVRGKILKTLLGKKSVEIRKLEELIRVDRDQFEKALTQLQKEGFITISKSKKISLLEPTSNLK